MLRLKELLSCWNDVLVVPGRGGYIHFSAWLAAPDRDRLAPFRMLTGREPRSPHFPSLPGETVSEVGAPLDGGGSRRVSTSRRALDVSTGRRRLDARTTTARVMGDSHFDQELRGRGGGTSGAPGSRNARALVSLTDALASGLLQKKRSATAMRTCRCSWSCLDSVNGAATTRPACVVSRLLFACCLFACLLPCSSSLQ